MINATAVRTVEVVGSLDTSSATHMGIDQEGMSIVIQILSNMYSDGAKAAVREYACNARDSHVAAGQARPIEVSLPSHLSPQLKIQDWGLGLSARELIEVFAQYGASTKRESNDQVGAFGIGSKSAFTVGTEFIVTAVKDNEKAIARFALDDHGRPTVQVLLQTVTDEPNGVLVDIGIEDVDAVWRAANWLFTAWPKGSVLVDGVAPESMWDKVEKVAHGVYVNWDNDFNLHPFTVVMGGVPYPIPASVLARLSPQVRPMHDQIHGAGSARFILEVPIGSVDITPSREELRDTPATVATIEERLKMLSNDLDKFLTDRIADAPNIWVAGRRYKDQCSKLGFMHDTHDVTYKGKSLEKSFITFEYPSLTLSRKSRYTTDFYGWKINKSKSFGVNMTSEDEWFDQTLIVTEVPDDKIHGCSQYAKQILFHGTVEGGKLYDRVVLSPHKSERHGWFSYGKGTPSPIPTMSYTDFRQRALELRKSRLKVTATSSGGSSTVTYEVNGESLTVAQIKALKKKIIYGTTHWSSVESNTTLGPLFKSKYVYLRQTSRQSTEVLLRRLPAAENYWDVASNKAQKILDRITQADTDLMVRATQSSWGTDVPNLVNWVKAHRSKITNTDALKFIDSATATSALTDTETKRVEELVWAHNALSKSTPNVERPNHRGWFNKNLPFFALTMDNLWRARSVWGTESAVDDALVDYVNSTTVSLV